MRFCIAKSKWEMWEAPLEAFLDRVTADGFQASEIYLRSLEEPPALCRDLHAQRGLGLIAQVSSDGTTVEDHRRSLEANIRHAAEFGPLKIDVHGGRDIFSFDDNVAILTAGMTVAEEVGIPICFETHRSRALFCIPACLAFVKALPDLRITADFSHFTVVHESNLADQMDNLRLLMTYARHVHARVGHGEGPQVSDPRAPEWREQTALFKGWWREIHALAQARGDAEFTITPEFGPVTYMPTIPFTNQPVADAWEINVWMRGMLSELFRAGTTAT